MRISQIHDSDLPHVQCVILLSNKMLEHMVNQVLENELFNNH